MFSSPFSPNDAMDTASGVRVSCSPRSTPVPHEDQQHAGGAEETDAQIGDGLRGELAGRSEQVYDKRSKRPAHHTDGQSDDRGQPQAVHPLAHRLPDVPRPQSPCDRGGGGVREEHAQPDEGRQGRAGHAESAERWIGEVADDDGVGEQEERLGHQCPECRDREPEDLPVMGTAVSGPRGKWHKPILRLTEPCSIGIEISGDFLSSTGRGYRNPRWRRSSPTWSHRCPQGRPQAFHMSGERTAHVVHRVVHWSSCRPAPGLGRLAHRAGVAVTAGQGV